MKKYMLTQLIAGLAAVSAFSATNQGMQNSSNGMHSSHKDSQEMSPYEQAQTKMITPPTGPVVKGGADVFVDLDFIYWTARQSGQPFSLSANVPSSVSADGQTQTQGSMNYVNGKYSPGFKVGIGALVDHDGWDAYLQYTWFRTKPTSDDFNGWLVQDPQLLNLIGFNSVFPFVNPSESSRTACGHRRFEFNDFTLELGRNFYISHKLQLRPHFGLRGGWQVQRYNVYWTLANPSHAQAGGLDWTNARYSSNNKNYFWNIGLKGGFDTSWLFTENWSIFGDFSLSTLWSEFTYTRNDRATTSGSTEASQNLENFQTLNIQDVSKQLTPVVDISLGLRFDWFFSNDDYRLRLQAGWENQVWFNTGRQLYFTGDSVLSNLSAIGNLSLQGFTLKARFDF